MSLNKTNKTKLLYIQTLKRGVFLLGLLGIVQPCKCIIPHPLTNVYTLERGDRNKRDNLIQSGF